MLQGGALALGYTGPPVFAAAAAAKYARRHLLDAHYPWADLERMQPFRERGASYAAAAAELGPVPPVADNDARYQWLIGWPAIRLFGWGRGPAALRAVAACHDDAAALEALVRQPESVLRGGGHGLPVYGSLTWSKAVDVETKLPALLHRLWGGLRRSEAAPGSPMPFADAAPLFNNPQAAKVKPIMENTKWPGLLSWLILCDLSSHFPGHVALPTLRDLAGFIISAAKSTVAGRAP